MLLIKKTIEILTPKIVTLALRSVGFMKLMTYGFWTSLVWV